MSKVSRTFRIDRELSRRLDKITIPPYTFTWHIEKALEDYLPNKTQVVKSEKPKKASGFIPPSIEELYAYFKEKNCPGAMGQAEQFFHFYESKGWKVGKNKMKNWKASVSGWINRMDKTQAKPSLMERRLDTSWADHMINPVTGLIE